MMRKNTLLFIIAGLILVTCQKENREQQTNGCIHSTPTRVPQNYYNLYTNNIPEVVYDSSHCGFLPLGKMNYWIYLDSVFDYNTGQFINSIIDTLRFEKTFMTYDSIIWWKPKVSSQPDYYYYYKGYYDRMYATDSTLYTLGEGAFGYKHSLTWCYPVYTDSTFDHCVWTDVPQSFCMGKKLNNDITVPAGSFSNCFHFTKWNTIGSQLDIWFKPGIGILKSRIYSPTNPYPTQVITRTSTLLGYHFE